MTQNYELSSFIRAFNLTDGKAFALDKRSVGFAREEASGRITVGLKLSGQRPVEIAGSFGDFYKWWTAPLPLKEGAPDADPR
jgi:hypothetical protein